MVVPSVASDARSVSGSTSKRWRSGPSRSPAATLAMRPCCPNRWPGSPPIRTSPVFTAPSHGLQANRFRATDGACDTRKYHAALAERGAHAVIPPRKNARPWKGSREVPSRATRPVGRRNIRAMRSGEAGADTAAEAASRCKPRDCRSPQAYPCRSAKAQSSAPSGWPFRFGRSWASPIRHAILRNWRIPWASSTYPSMISWRGSES